MSSQPNYDFLNDSITPATKPTKSKSKVVKKTPTKPKVKPSKMNMTQAPPNFSQQKPKPPVKSKPKVIAVVKKTKPTPQQKPNNPNVMSPTNMDKLKQSNNQVEYLKN